MSLLSEIMNSSTSQNNNYLDNFVRSQLGQLGANVADRGNIISSGTQRYLGDITNSGQTERAGIEQSGATDRARIQASANNLQHVNRQNRWEQSYNNLVSPLAGSLFGLDFGSVDARLPDYATRDPSQSGGGQLAAALTSPNQQQSPQSQYGDIMMGMPPLFNGGGARPVQQVQPQQQPYDDGRWSRHRGSI